MIRFYGVVLYTLTILMIIKFIDYPLAEFVKYDFIPEVKSFFQLITDFVKSTCWIFCSIMVYFIFVFRNGFCIRTFAIFIKEECVRIFVSRTALLLYLSVSFSGIFVNIFKPIFGRVRPYFFFESGEKGFQFFQFGSSFASFPSGHSATALSIATVFAVSFPKWKYYFFSIGVIFAFSRVATSNHYFSDVIIGGTIGFLTTIYFHRRLNAIF
jgi:membrane-associated phospholipid phosphatase